LREAATSGPSIFQEQLRDGLQGGAKRKLGVAVSWEWSQRKGAWRMGKDLMLGGLEHLKRWKRRPRMIFPRALESKTHVLRRAPWTGPGSGPAPGVVTTECSAGEGGAGPPNGLGPLIALGSVHVIDAGETALVEGLRAAPWECGKGLAGMLQSFCSQLVKRRHPGVKVARLTRDDQLASRELKKYHLITKQRDVLPGGIIIQDWQPYRPSESNLSLLAAKGLEGRVDSRARPRVLTLCTRPFPIPPGGNGTWRYLNIYAFGSDGAQVQSQLLWHLQRQAPRLVGLNVMCQLFLAPQLWLADFCQAGLGLELVKGYTEQYLLEADI
ncbi:hypothetical protein E2I00_014882, partial [Balaenoptera physalus]